MTFTRSLNCPPLLTGSEGLNPCACHLLAIFTHQLSK